MAVTVFNLTGTGGTNASSSIFFNGDTADSTQSSRNARKLSARNGEVTFTVTGTQATLEGYGTGVSTQPVSVSVDGGAFTAITALTLSTWTTITLFTGLSDAAHTVIVRDQGTTAGLNFYVDRDSVVTVTGAAPAIAAPTNYGTQYKLRTAGVSNYIVPEGGEGNLTSQGNTCFTINRVDGSFHFKGTISTLTAWVFRDSRKWCLWVDGVQHAFGTIASGSDWGRTTIATDLDGTAEHDYVLQSATASVIWVDFVTSGGTGINTTTLAARAHDAFYGDSKTAGTASTNTASYDGFAFKVAMLRGHACHNRGIAGTAMRNYGAGGGLCTTSAGETRTVDITGLSPVPVAVFIEYGVNDALAGCGTAPTAAEFKTSWAAMISAIAAGVPSTVPIYSMPITKTCGNGTGDTNIDLYNPKIIEAVNESGQANQRSLPTGFVATVLHPSATDNTTWAGLINTAALTDSTSPMHRNNQLSGGLLTLGV